MSQPTLSRVFNRHPNVREEVRKRVLAAARRHGYVPRVAPRRVSVAVLVGTLKQISLHGYETLVATYLSRHFIQSGIDYEIMPVSQLDNVAAHCLQGIVTVVYDPSAIERISALKDIPVVAVNGMGVLPSVSSDHPGGCRQAAEYLLDRGHRRIGLLLSGTLEIHASRLRHEGYRQALQAAGIAEDAGLIQCYGKQPMSEAVDKLCRKGATALIALGEDMPLQVFHALCQLGKKIPDDISVIVSENPQVTPFTWPPFTAIDQDFDRICERAVYHLMARIAAGTPARRLNELIPNRLIERESVRPVASGGRRTRGQS